MGIFDFRSLILSGVRFAGLIIFVLIFQNCGKGFEVAQEGSNLESSVTENIIDEESVSVSCQPGYHEEMNICVANVRSCPVANGVGEQLWNGISFGECQVVSCMLNYNNTNNTCQFSPMSCPIQYGNGQTDSNGICQLISCNSGYHSNGNVCDPNQRSCAVTNGAGIQVWNGNAYGNCQVATCNSLYHIEANSCVSNTQLCSITNGAGMQTWNGTAYGDCMLVACNSGYMINGSVCTPISTTNSGWTPRSSARFFISGHSLTDDPLADYILDIAAKKGDSGNYNQQLILGSPIRSRTRGSSMTEWPGYSMGKNRNGTFNLNVISELRNPQTIGNNQLYDSLIIAENHHSLSNIQWNNTIGYLRHFHDRLIEGNPEARTFFYNTWLDVDKTSPAQWIELEKQTTVAWECVASKVNLTLELEGRRDRVFNLPASAALVDLVERVMANQVGGISGTITQKMNMIFSDDVHMTPLGVYYLSLVTYSAVYAKSPSGVLPPTDSGVSASLASQLQSIAWNFTSLYYNRPNPGTRDMASCRNYIQQQTCGTYMNFIGRPDLVSACQDYFSGSSSPFLWPDPNFEPYPAP